MTYTWEFDDMVNPTLQLSGLRSDNMTVSLTSAMDVSLASDITMGRVLYVHGPSDGLTYLLAADDDCLSDSFNCRRGVSVEFYIYRVNMSDCVIVDTRTDGNTGIKIWIDSE